ncbi:type II CAAX prenyl endopeptidase Rce1 family protein [Fimbriiglobus ruber]|nr:CPBP family glutamic-type intramembrane protease [Fimbriiglobus ruber]
MPLIIVYEGGVLYFGGADPDSLRNGADAWLRWTLKQYGMGQMWVAPLIVVGLLLIRSFFRWSDRPEEILPTIFGMTIESLVYAVGLWAIARNFEALVQQAGIPVNSISFQSPAAAQLVTYVGAGIYEEVLFRLALFGGVCFFLRLMLPTVVAVPLATVAAALAFAAAHHVGPNGEEVVTIKFLFRATAGLYFTILYVARGFGIAVGAHAAYDILVGVAVG